MTGASRRRLSTGHLVSLPLELSFAMGGVVVPARRERLDRVLPEELSPLRIAPGLGAVALVGIQYHRVGGSGDPSTGLEPYDEFGVVVPSVRRPRFDLPLVELTGEIGGYVHWLPVTTDASVALGRELWGYPKERADVTVTDGPNGLRTAVDGGRALRLEVPRIGGRDREWTASSFTTRDGALVRTRAEIRGRVGVRPGVGSTLEFGPRVPEELRRLELRPLPLVEMYGSRVRARLFAGETQSDETDRG